jgi:simple sugar transport system ATP-binding protein
MTGAEPQNVLEATRISKSYGHVRALTEISIALRRGEVLAIFGDNGAGKSTLLKVLCGVVSPDAGQLVVEGKTVGFGSVREAQALGIDAVYQDLALAPDLTVLENIFLGHERISRGWRARLGWLDRRAMAAQATSALDSLGVSLPSVRVPVTSLSGGQAQAVAIARATMWAKNCVLLDEPTAALGVRQSMIVDKLIRSTADRGLGVLVISHDIPRILKVADRVTILRHGEIVLSEDARNLDVTRVVGAIVGETIASEAQ